MTLSTLLRPTALLAAALGLAACGGKASFPINGTAYGLQYSGLVITTNGMDLPIAPIPPTAAAPNTVPPVNFSFPNSLSYGETFNITFKSQPAHQTCNTIDPTTGRDTATDTAGRTVAIHIGLSCSVNSYAIGGSVTGLNTTGLVLTNGSAGGTATVGSGATTYSFSNLVAYNLSYGVTVLTQPANAFCTVDNATGVMGDAAVTNINVSCVPA
jgi:hypothetical protein